MPKLKKMVRKFFSEMARRVRKIKFQAPKSQHSKSKITGIKNYSTAVFSSAANV